MYLCQHHVHSSIYGNSCQSGMNYQWKAVLMHQTVYQKQSTEIIKLGRLVYLAIFKICLILSKSMEVLSAIISVSSLSRPCSDKESTHTHTHTRTRNSSIFYTQQKMTHQRSHQPLKVLSFPRTQQPTQTPTTDWSIPTTYQGEAGLTPQVRDMITFLQREIQPSIMHEVKLSQTFKAPFEPFIQAGETFEDERWRGQPVGTSKQKPSKDRSHLSRVCMDISFRTTTTTTRPFKIPLHRCSSFDHQPFRPVPNNES